MRILIEKQFRCVFTSRTDVNLLRPMIFDRSIQVFDQRTSYIIYIINRKAGQID